MHVVFLIINVLCDFWGDGECLQTIGVSGKIFCDLKVGESLEYKAQILFFSIIISLKP